LGDRCPFKFRFSPPYLFLVVFRVGFVEARRARRLSCGGAVRVAGSTGREEGAALRVLENGDREESPSLVLGVGEKEREMGSICWLGLEDERKWGEW
jgi:hypothetical protein